MRRLSDRGQVEPFAALAAVLAVSAGLVLYAGALNDSLPAEQNRETIETALERVHDSLQSTGVVEPERLDGGAVTVADGWHANVTLRAGGQQWARGQSPPEDANRARRRVSVRTDPMEIRPGQLRVVIWQ